MNRNLLKISAAAMAVLLASIGLLSADHLTGLTLFGITFARNELVSVNPTTGEAAIVGSLGETIFAFGIAVRNGRLYTYDQVNHRIREINKISGRLISSIDIGAGNLNGEGALAFRPSDGVGFIAAPLNGTNQPVNDFYTFTLDPPAAVRLGSTGVAIDGLAFNTQGTLYAIGQDSATLYTINVTTGAATPVGPIKVGANTVIKNNPIAGMTIAPANSAGVQEIYASIEDRLYIIDPTTAAARFASADVINFGPFVSSVSGLAFSPGAGTLGNMSGRLSVGTDERVGIGGFIVRGTPSKQIVLRGLGPSTNLRGVLADPVLELFNAQGQSLARNDDFETSPDKATVQALGLSPGNPKESAIVRTLPEGAYTVILSGANRTTGIGLVEIFDVNTGAASRLANLSTRGFVQLGDNILIGGIIVSGSAPQRIVSRGIGPSLTARGVQNALADPNIELFNANGMSIKFNDNFMMDPDAAEIATLGLAPGNGLEAATILNLAPGNYTAIVRGAGNSTGVALVETYNVTTAPAPAQ